MVKVISMEIINSKSPEFNAARYDNEEMHIHFGDRRLSINANTVRRYNMKAGQYLHFVVDIDYLYFFINDDSSGMKLFKRDKGLHGYVKTRVKILAKKLPRYKLLGNFPVKEAATRLNDHKLIIIMLHKKLKKDKDD